MERLSYPLLALLAHWFTPQFNARLKFLEAQIRMLRSRLDTNRIVPSEQEKDELLRLGAQLDHDVGDLMHVVRPRTYRKWLNRRRGLKRVRRAGRPRMPTERSAANNNSVDSSSPTTETQRKSQMKSLAHPEGELHPPHVIRTAPTETLAQILLKIDFLG